MHNNASNLIHDGSVALTNSEPECSIPQVMFLAEMLIGCGMQTWTTNSIIRHAVADTPAGPYTPKEIIMHPFAHNPTAIQAPDGTYLVHARYVISTYTPSMVSHSHCCIHGRGADRVAGCIEHCCHLTYRAHSFVRALTVSCQGIGGAPRSRDHLFTLLNSFVYECWQRA